MSSASSGKFAGLSLWLVPRGPSGQAEALRELMGNLRDEVAASHGPTSVSARFEPHVTLLAGLQEGKGWTRQAVWAKTLKVLKDKRQRGEAPIVCPLQDVVTRGSYFQCIVVALEKTKDLMGLNEAMRRAFSVDESEPSYFPHCSLVYADLDEEQADAEIAVMESQGVFKREQGRAGITLDHMDHITLHAVELWDSNGAVGDWRKLEEYVFSEVYQ